jgi:hypothetical protein
LIVGDCIARPALDGYFGVTNIFQPFRQLTCYLCMGTYSGTNGAVGHCGCGRKTAPDGSFMSSSFGTSTLQPLILASGTYSRGELYGRKPLNTLSQANPLDLKRRSNGDPVYFKTAEFQPWRKRSKIDLVAGNTGYTDFATGPAMRHGFLTMPLRRRLKGTTGQHNRNYQGRMSYDFTNASDPINGQTDWLGFLHPANHIWTNEGVSEPFLAVNYYEDSGTSPSPADSLYQYTMPFCSPMSVYDATGTKIGEYNGYTAQMYFALAYVHFADAKNWVYNPTTQASSQVPAFLPYDYRSPTNPQTGKPTAKIRHVEQLLTLDITIFMVGNNAQLGSPRIARTRYWWYNDPNTKLWFNQPYMCGFVTSGVYPSWNFPVRFEILDAVNTPTAPETITLNFDPMSVWVTA